MTRAQPPVASVDWHTHAVAAGGRQWSYREVGAGELVLLLEPPGGRVSDHRPLEPLADHYRLVAPALEPNRPTTGAAENEASREAGRLLRQFVEALGADHVAVISRGSAATVALWLALENPETVTKLVLESPPLLDPRAAYGPADLLTAMTTLEVPTLVLIGERTIAASPQRASAYRLLLPASTVGLVYQAGEDIRGERPAAYLSAVSDYLERGQAFVVSSKSTVIHA